MDAGIIPSIPRAALLSYLNEGAANIVYRIEIRVPTPPPSMLEEYGSGTPPPSAIEDYLAQETDDTEDYNSEDLQVFESASCSCPLASSKPSMGPLFTPVRVTPLSNYR
jgi:inositol-pentakisphosphate 2-kinase